ncbi:MAG: Asp-tRNA(Asn)/Glu-tRNA(Gln) amidotransferase subunit GatB [Bacillota bacterium]
MNREIVIGLEVHAELKTETKIFCGCLTRFGAAPNSQVCPVCLGLPGVLPVLNRKALLYTIKAGLALNCEIASFSKFDRKNYFYPDLPKAYQISQYDLPVCRKGWLSIALPSGETKKIGITRIHLEEEAGKSVHAGDSIIDAAYSLEDYNRCGIPLIEIVSEPDLRSLEEVQSYLEKLKAILEYTEVSECKMQEGDLRCDANISLRPRGSAEFGTRTEIKNLNSFRAVLASLAYEIKRQNSVLDSGGAVSQDTLAWDENKGKTVSMRSKEEAHDYRYFPEPDLVPVRITGELVEEIRSTLPELPDERRKRFEESYGLPRYDADFLTADKKMADFFEETMKEYGGAPKNVSNWIMGELARLLNASQRGIEDIALTPRHLSQLLRLLDEGTISGKIAKAVFSAMYAEGGMPLDIIKEKGLLQISDAGELAAIVEEVIRTNRASVGSYLGGKVQALGFLMGQVMKATQGKANPGMVNDMLKERLEKERDK